jgi:hypothetical protein
MSTCELKLGRSFEIEKRTNASPPTGTQDYDGRIMINDFAKGKNDVRRKC